MLGLNRDTAAMHVVTEVDAETGALLARNAFRPDFSRRVAFADVDRRPAHAHGRPPGVPRPARLARRPGGAGSRRTLAERVGAALDPCAAIQVRFELRPGAEAEVVFLLGEADDVEAARAAASGATASRAARRGRSRRSRPAGTTGLGAVQVRTPDPALDLLANRWLLYQVLACRYWARSGFYQSGGAYGFRDQLQDVMALVHAAPEMTRAHILRAAARQFLEGDVQHWWHPPTGRGIRTRISDDPALAAVRRRLLHRRHRRRRDPRRAGRLPRGAPAEARARRTTTACRPPPVSPARSTSIACGAWSAWTIGAPTACR